MSLVLVLMMRTTGPPLLDPLIASFQEFEHRLNQETWRLYCTDNLDFCLDGRGVRGQIGDGPFFVDRKAEQSASGIETEAMRTVL